MTHTIKLSTRDTIAELRKAIKESNDEAQKTRIRAIINLRKGTTRTKTSEAFSVTRTTLRKWIVAYNKGGVDALKFSKGGRSGGNPIWNPTIFDDLAKEVDKGGKCWSIPMMQDWIEENYRKEVPESTVWYHIKRLDYSYKSVRPHPYKGDKERQETFKKRA